MHESVGPVYVPVVRGAYRQRCRINAMRQAELIERRKRDASVLELDIDKQHTGPWNQHWRDHGLVVS